MSSGDVEAPTASAKATDPQNDLSRLAETHADSASPHRAASALGPPRSGAFSGSGWMSLVGWCGGEVRWSRGPPGRDMHLTSGSGSTSMQKYVRGLCL